MDRINADCAGSVREQSRCCDSADRWLSSSTVSQHLLCEQPVPVHHGDSSVTEDGDTVLRILCLWLAILPSRRLPTRLVIFRAICLFVCQSQVLYRVMPREAESPISHIKNPAPINRKMEHRPTNAGKCFHRIKKLETDGSAQWHAEVEQLEPSNCPELLSAKRKTAWETSTYIPLRTVNITAYIRD